MAQHCTTWKKEQRASGRTVHVRQCADGGLAEIVHGDGYYTYNLYRNGKHLTRGSRKTLKDAKRTATRKL